MFPVHEQVFLPGFIWNRCVVTSLGPRSELFKSAPEVAAAGRREYFQGARTRLTCHLLVACSTLVLSHVTFVLTANSHENLQVEGILCPSSLDTHYTAPALKRRSLGDQGGDHRQSLAGAFQIAVLRAAGEGPTGGDAAIALIMP